MIFFTESTSLIPAAALYLLLKSSLVAGSVTSYPPRQAFVTVRGESEFYTDNGQLLKDSYRIKTSLDLFGSNQMRILDQTNIHHYSVRMAGTNEWKDLGTVSDSKVASEISGIGSTGLSSHINVPLETGETLVLDSKQGSNGNVVVEAKIESVTLYQWIFNSFSRIDKNIQYPLVFLIVLLVILLILIGSLLNDALSFTRKNGSAEYNFALHPKDLLSNYFNKKKGYQSLKAADIEP